MSLDSALRERLSIPAFCAPMFQISGPELVIAACKAGIVGGIPFQNAASPEVFESWLQQIHRELAEFVDAHPRAKCGPIAANIPLQYHGDLEREALDLCARYGVEIVVSAAGDPTERTKRLHDLGMQAYHDVTSVRFAEKAISAKVDGLIAIGAGGGGHSGVISPLVLIPRLREMFDGPIIMAGCVSNGAAIRAAEILGADLAYLGTRFIATKEANAPEEYKTMLLESDESELRYTASLSGIPANWLVRSIQKLGLDPDNLPVVSSRKDLRLLPEHVRPWKTLWSAGQGIGLIADIPSVAELVERLQREYELACTIPALHDRAPA